MFSCVQDRSATKKKGACRKKYKRTSRGTSSARKWNSPVRGSQPQMYAGRVLYLNDVRLSVAGPPLCLFLSFIFRSDHTRTSKDVR